MFKFLKKKKEAPPDIGQEEAEEAPSEDNTGPDLEEIEMKGNKKSETGQLRRETVGRNAPSYSEMELEKIKGRIDSIVEWINQFYERFSYFSESIGEIRAMNLDNEKKISSAMKEAEKVIDIVKEVKPEALRLDYQKADMRMRTWEEKLEANRIMMDDVLKEFNELKKKADVFVGVEGVLKLNEEVKGDLLEVQKISSKVRMNADKAEEVFSEIKDNFSEMQKTEGIISDLDANYSGIKKEVEKLQIDYRNIVNQDDFLKFTKTFGNKIALYDSHSLDIESLKNKIKELEDLISTSVSISKRNEEDIADISLKTGNEDSSLITDYKTQLADLISIVDTLTDEVNVLKGKLKIKENHEERKLNKEKKIIEKKQKRLAEKEKKISDKKDKNKKARKKNTNEITRNKTKTNKMKNEKNIKEKEEHEKNEKEETEESENNDSEGKKNTKESEEKDENEKSGDREEKSEENEKKQDEEEEDENGGDENEEDGKSEKKEENYRDQLKQDSDSIVKKILNKVKGK